MQSPHFPESSDGRVLQPRRGAGEQQASVQRTQRLGTLPLGSVPGGSCRIDSLAASPRGAGLSGGVFVTNVAFLGAHGYFVKMHSRQTRAE